MDHNQLKKYGMYKSALNELDKLINNTKEIDERIYHKECKKQIERMISVLRQVEIGEAYFPVVDPKNPKIGGLRVIKVINSGSEVQPKLEKSWNKVKEFITKFLDNYLNENIKNVMVFDWGFDQYSVKIKNEDGDLLDDVEGESLELSMALALLSLVLEERVNPNLAFTGRVVFENDIYQIGMVNYIQDKTNILQQEYDFIENLVVPYKSNKNDGFQIQFSRFDELVKYIYPELDALLKNNISKLGCRKIYARMSVTSTVDNIECQLVKIKQDRVELEDWEKYVKFIKNLEDIIWKQDLPVIIDGVVLNFFAPILVECSKNHVKKFLALRNTNFVEENGYANAAIVAKTASCREFYLGQKIQYKKRD